MVLVYCILSFVVAAAHIAMLWPVSALLAVATAPISASAGVLLLAIIVTGCRSSDRAQTAAHAGLRFDAISGGAPHLKGCAFADQRELEAAAYADKAADLQGGDREMAEAKALTRASRHRRVEA